MTTPAEDEQNWQDLSPDILAEWVVRREPFPGRTFAIQHLAHVWREHPSLSKIFCQALADENPSVRRRAAQTLGQYWPWEDPIEEILRELGRSDAIWTVREAAVLAMRQSVLSLSSDDDSRSATDYLIEVVLTDREPLIRDAGVLGLAEVLNHLYVTDENKTDLWQQLIERYEHPHASRRCRVVIAISRLADKNPIAYPLMRRALADSHWKVRRAASRSLGIRSRVLHSPLGKHQVLPELLKRRFDQHPSVREAVVQSLQRQLSTHGDSGLIETVVSQNSAVDALQSCLSHVEMTKLAESEFRQVCRQRKGWHAAKMGDSFNPIDTSTSFEELVASVLDDAERWMVPKRETGNSIREKEAAWLLARLAEAVFAPVEES